MNIFNTLSSYEIYSSDEIIVVMDGKEIDRGNVFEILKKDYADVYGSNLVVSVKTCPRSAFEIFPKFSKKHWIGRYVRIEAITIIDIDSLFDLRDKNNNSEKETKDE